MLELASIRGPMNLPKANTHEMEDGNSMYEFIKGNFRIAYFYDANKVVICSHLFRKSTRKTPTAEQEIANRMRANYNRDKLDSNLHFI